MSRTDCWWKRRERAGNSGGRARKWHNKNWLGKSHPRGLVQGEQRMVAAFQGGADESGQG